MLGGRPLGVAPVRRAVDERRPARRARRVAAAATGTRLVRRRGRRRRGAGQRHRQPAAAPAHRGGAARRHACRRHPRRVRPRADGVAEWALALDDVARSPTAWTPTSSTSASCSALDSVTLATVVEGDGLRRTRHAGRARASRRSAHAPRLTYTEMLDKLPDLEPLIVDDIGDRRVRSPDSGASDLDAPRAVMIVPLGASGHLDGVLAVTSDRRPRPVGDGRGRLRPGDRRRSSPRHIGRRRMEASLRRRQAPARGDARRLLGLRAGRSTTTASIQYANLAVRRNLEHDDRGDRRRTRLRTDPPGRPAARRRTLRRTDARRPERRTPGCGPCAPTAPWPAGGRSSAARSATRLIGGTILTCRDVTSHVAAEAAEATRVPRLRHTFELAQRAFDIGPDAFLAQLDDGVRRHRRDARRRHRPGSSSSTTAARMLAGIGLLRAASGHGADRTAVLDDAPLDASGCASPTPVHVESVRDCDEPWAVEWRDAGRLRRRDDGGGHVGRRSARRRAGRGDAQLGGRSGTTPRSAYLRLVAETIAHVLERDRLDAALRASEARFRILSETAADVVILIDERGTIAYASPSSHACSATPRRS